MLLKVCSLLIASEQTPPQKFSPIALLYNRKAVLPNDIKQNTKDLSNLRQTIWQRYVRYSSRVNNNFFKKPDSP